LADAWITAPFDDELYDEEDPCRYLDCLLQIYGAIGERIYADGGLTEEMKAAVWNTPPACATAVATYAGALAATSERPVAVMHLLRDSMQAIVRVGTDWRRIPHDSMPPSQDAMLLELLSRFEGWSDGYDLPKIPPAELMVNLVKMYLNFNTTTWPPLAEEGWGPLDSYSVMDEENMPPVQTTARVLRLPLGIGALLSWRDNWMNGWPTDDVFEVSDGMHLVATRVREELMPAVSMWMERTGDEWPDWAEDLLPGNNLSAD